MEEPPFCVYGALLKPVRHYLTETSNAKLPNAVEPAGGKQGNKPDV